jgi:hypothetical protein
MKLQLLTLLFSIVIISSLHSQNITSSIKHVESFTEKSFDYSANSNDNYLLYRAEHMFKIIEIRADKIVEYPSLNQIQYKTFSSDPEYIEISINEFIELFNQNKISPLLLNIKREKENEVWYRLGNTNFVLIGFPEDKISMDYKKMTK